MSQRLYTLPEASEILFGTAGKTRALRTEIHKGRLDARNIAGAYYVTETDLQEFMERCRAKPARRDSKPSKANGSSETAGSSTELDSVLTSAPIGTTTPIISMR